MMVRVRAPRAIPTQPGCYFYVHLPHKHIFESCLAPVAWWDRTAKDSTEEFTFLLEDKWASGLNKKSQVRLDGPYGKKINVGQYKTIILAANGMGISGVLSFALSVLSRRQSDMEKRVSRRDKVDKLDLYWKLDHTSNFQWVSDFFQELNKIEVTHVGRTFLTLLPEDNDTIQ